MNIGEYSIERPVISWLIVVILVFGGLWAFDRMGKLEDPAFTIKVAKIITLYPGASAQQVQDEVTYHIENALQRMEQIKHIKMSISRPGMSDIQIEFKDKYRAEDFPNIYDELRRKIADMRSQLPPGAQDPMIIDEFGDVYGIYLALTGEGYSWRDLWDFSDRLKRELVLVPGVRKVMIGGEQKEVVYVDISRARLGELGISPAQIAAILKSQNVVVDAGRVQVGPEYLRISPTGEFASVEEIGELVITSSGGSLVRVRDVAEVSWGAREREEIIRVGGVEAVEIAIYKEGGANTVTVSDAVTERIGELQPVGIAESEIRVLAELVVLLPGYEPVLVVGPDQHNDVAVEASRRFHVLGIHQEAGVARDRDDIAPGMHQLGGNRTGHRYTHAGKAVGNQAGVRLLAAKHTCHPHLVRADVADDDVLQVQRRAQGDGRGDDRVSHLVVGDDLALARIEQAVLALEPGDDALDACVEVGERDLLGAAAGGSERSLIDQVGDFRSAEPGDGAGDGGQIDGSAQGRGRGVAQRCGCDNGLCRRRRDFAQGTSQDC